MSYNKKFKIYDPKTVSSRPSKIWKCTRRFRVDFTEEKNISINIVFPRPTPPKR